jgi:hypothetical protein
LGTRTAGPYLYSYNCTAPTRTWYGFSVRAKSLAGTARNYRSATESPSKIQATGCAQQRATVEPCTAVDLRHGFCTEKRGDVIWLLLPKVSCCVRVHPMPPPPPAAAAAAAALPLCVSSPSPRELPWAGRWPPCCHGLGAGAWHRVVLSAPSSRLSWPLRCVSGSGKCWWHACYSLGRASSWVLGVVGR